jgi:anti-anti-sigma regulatory factor
MKDFAKEMVSRGHRQFVVDLKNCPVMDSTFMGTLAMIALRLRDIGQGRLRVVNLNERNRDLLTNLGLDQLFDMEDDEAPAAVAAQQPLDGSATGGKSAQAQTMLDAHQALVDANPENLTKFKDVLEYLKQDLRNTAE